MALTELNAVDELGRPRYVDVAGQGFEIVYVDNTDDNIPLASPDKSGRMILTKQRIIIDTDNGPDQLRDVTLHELVHACLAVVMDDNPDAVEERMVSALAPMLLYVLRRNPHIVAWLTDVG